jgi:hypothetical protein
MSAAYCNSNVSDLEKHPLFVPSSAAPICSLDHPCSRHKSARSFVCAADAISDATRSCTKSWIRGDTERLNRCSLKSCTETVRGESTTADCVLHA